MLTQTASVLRSPPLTLIAAPSLKCILKPLLSGKVLKVDARGLLSFCIGVINITVAIIAMDSIYTVYHNVLIIIFIFCFRVVMITMTIILISFEIIIDAFSYFSSVSLRTEINRISHFLIFLRILSIPSCTFAFVITF